MITTLPEPLTVCPRVHYAVCDLAGLFDNFFSDCQLSDCLESTNTRAWGVRVGPLLVGALVAVRSRPCLFQQHLLFLGVHPHHDQQAEEQLLDQYLQSLPDRTVLTAFSGLEEFSRIDLLLSRGFEIKGETDVFCIPQISFRRGR